MNPLRAVNGLRWWPRWGVKGLFLLLVLVGVTYPHPSLLVRDVRHTWDMDALIDETEPTLQPWMEELRAGLAEAPDASDQQVFQAVEHFVHDRIPYEWDWNTWGVMDYTPTVAEVVEMGREDCDGRAVVAASLLRGIGYEPRLVGNPLHVWVWTPQGEFMGPAGPKTFEPTETGSRFNWSSVVNWPSNLAFGLAVYPLGRELVLLVAVWLCGLKLVARRWTWVVSLLLLIQGLLLIRLSAGDHRSIIHWGVWLAWLYWVAGLAVLWFAPASRRKLAASPA